MACLEMFNNTEQQHQSSSSNNNNNNNNNSSLLLCAHPPPMSPRISFSNDFVDTPQAIKQLNEQQQRMSSSRSSTSESSSAPNFEFSSSVPNFTMLSTADELFSKGRLLPFKQDIINGKNNKVITTLRDELLNDDDDIFSMRPPKGPIKWKEFLGLNKRTHILSSKNNNKGHDDQNRKIMNSDGSTVLMERVVEGNESTFIQKEQEEEEEHLSKISSDLEVLSDHGIGGSSCRENVEIGI